MNRAMSASIAAARSKIFYSSYHKQVNDYKQALIMRQLDHLPFYILFFLDNKLCSCYCLYVLDSNLGIFIL